MMEAVPAAADDSSSANPSSVKSDDSSPRRDSGAGSPPPNCAICLGTCKNKSFTDSCLHQFCFSCLLTWSKVKAECPLCKQAFRSIIHNVRSNHQYEEYLVVQRQNEETSSRIDIDSLTASTRRFRYRTTLTLPRRETLAIQQLLLHYPLVADVFPPPARAPPARRRRSPASFRRTVYRHNLWARPLPDFTGRFRDCSPEFYRYNDTQMHRLVPWLNRELHYLLNENVGHVSYVMARILELLPQHHLGSAEFRDAMQRYFGDRTEHFLHELYCYASTPYDMTGYDRNVQYTTDSRISTMVNEVISSSDSDASVDSDIVMVSSSEPAEPPAGPSRPPAPVYPQGYISRPAADNVIPIETISQSDTDDDSSEVMVVGYIKPPQDRTPEVVDLLGSDSDVVVQDAASPAPAAPAPEPADARPPVRLTLKRQRPPSEDAAPVSDSSDSSYEPPPRPRRRRTRDEPLGADSRSDGDSALSSPSTGTSSDDERRSRPTGRKTVKRAGGRGRRSSRSRRDKRSSTRSERDKRSKRKSNSGKGVKSSRKAGEASAAVERPAPEQAGPSASGGPRRRSSGEEAGERRRRDSRETRRLRSVVNVMYNSSHRNTGDSNSNGSNASVVSNAATGSTRSDTESMADWSDPRVPRRDCNDASESLDRRGQPESSDSEDNLPLNLTLQKLCPYSS